MSILDYNDIYKTFLTDDIIESAGFRPRRQISRQILKGIRIPGQFYSIIPIGGYTVDGYTVDGYADKHEWINLRSIKYDENSLFDDYDHTYEIQIHTNIDWTSKCINKELGYPKYITSLGELIEEVLKIYKFIEDDGLWIPQTAKLFT